ncbi:Signal transduction histidine kinase [Mariniphaga anaerophila]|uniref:histidine kinase n=1 Tax=Mariniphaga anaerophila TaxID=1484053 RepID=A0A1M4WNM4_9BACT|nr:HAMP domain-containing sensor histidine kinase [Mariniphaga anaerophila]SHE82814.1 Signal transduction histidine kinase [Mariniphaga anaerophila]
MKLFHKTLQIYLTFSIVVFIISIPLFYFLVEKLWIEDVDDSLFFHKEKIIAGISTSGIDSLAIDNFTRVALDFDLGISVFPLNENAAEKDSVYYNKFYDETRTHIEPFRELKSVVNVDGRSYEILIRKDLVESADLIRGIAITQSILFFVLLAGLILLNNYFAKKTWRPFYHLVSRLNTFRIDKEQPIEPEKSNINEFNDLGNSVSELTKNNIRRYKAQKEFTENAAHETQTPLAVIRTQTDLFAQDKNLTKEQARIVEKMDKNITYLNKLNRNLLLLAKIDNDQFSLNEKTDVFLVLQETIDIFSEQIGLKGIQLKQNLNHHPVILSNSYLMQLLFTNLIKNAVKYNVHGGFVEIELNAGFFKIVNSGDEQPLPANAIFKRFYKQGTSETSSGLGLAIASRICELLQLKIEYNFEKPNRHCFKIILK